MRTGRNGRRSEERHEQERDGRRESIVSIAGKFASRQVGKLASSRQFMSLIHLVPLGFSPLVLLAVSGYPSRCRPVLRLVLLSCFLISFPRFVLMRDAGAFNRLPLCDE